MLSTEQQKAVTARLRRIEGQVVGIQKMVADGKYCVDVLLQLGAAQAALGKVADIVLENHIATCVTDSLKVGSEAQRAKKIEELINVFSKYSRSASR